MSLITHITHRTARRLLNPRRYVTGMPETAGSDRPAVYLTFDDGPHPVRTSRILDQLAESGSSATFFAIGRLARRYPHVVRQALTEGHAVGCHTWRHWSSRRQPFQVYVDDVRHSRDELEQITGRRIDLFRPPYGELTPRVLITLLLDGFRIVHWTRDTRDFELPTVPDLWQRFADEPLADGDIVLMHDDRCVTSHALSGCLQAWGSSVEFRAIPMQTDTLLKPPALHPRSRNRAAPDQQPLAAAGLEP